MSLSDFSTLFCKILHQNGLDRFCNDEIIGQFERFTERYLAQNAVSNISAIRTVPEIIAKHYADCLLAEEILPAEATLLDVGCGGGFPCIPLAIVRPDLKITAVDSTAKKVQFVAETAKNLHLSGLNAVCARAESPEFTQKHRGSFDLVTSRAVASLPVLAELTLPFVRRGGLLVALKGAQAEEELKNAQNAIRTLGGTFENDRICRLFVPKKEENQAIFSENGAECAFDPEERHLLLVRKTAPTDRKYPRAYAAICKKPL